jgi:predicted  nucleic acid-binding Zn-ribbon protein
MTELEPISRLQSLDERIAQLQTEISALPKHIALIERTLETHSKRLEADRAALSTNQKDRKRFEDDIKAGELKISKFRDQTLQAKTNEQYRAFQHEIEFCQAEIRKLEDRILELMGESEPLDAAVKKAEAALKQEKQHVETEKTRARERTAVDQKQLEVAQAERKEIVAGLKPALSNAYERIRKKWHGSVLAEVINGHCAACQISLRPQHFQELRKGDQIMFCESCGRILFYNPPVAVPVEPVSRPAEPRV